MSTTTVKRALASANADAEAFRDLFPANCYESWTFAGSVRRGRPEVGDIEHVVIPRFGEVDVSGMLFAEKKTVNLLWHRLDDLLKAQRVEQHVYGGSNPTTGVYTPTAFRWGEKYRGCDFRGFCHELFTADADNFGSRLAICTGPGGYSKMLVTRLQYQGYWNNRGYVWDKRQISCTCGWAGGWNDARFGKPERGDPSPKFTNGNREAVLCPKCKYGDGIRMPLVKVPTEESYFALCGERWIEPSRRLDPVVAAGGMR